MHIFIKLSTYVYNNVYNIPYITNILNPSCSMYVYTRAIWNVNSQPSSHRQHLRRAIFQSVYVIPLKTLINHKGLKDPLPNARTWTLYDDEPPITCSLLTIQYMVHIIENNQIHNIAFHCASKWKRDWVSEWVYDWINQSFSLSLSQVRLSVAIQWLSEWVHEWVNEWVSE